MWAKKLDAIHLNHFCDVTTVISPSLMVWALVGGCCVLAKLPNTSNDSVIDLCAAPGGKTAQLISTGAKVIAVEKNQNE